MTVEARTLALAELTATTAHPLELAEAAAAAGFDAITVRLSPADRGDGLRFDRATLRRMKRRLDELDLFVLEALIARLRPQTSRSELEQLVDDAGELGASYLNTVVDYPSSEQTASELAWLAGICETRGMRPALEFMPYSHVQTLAQAEQVIEMAGAQSAVLLVDALHLARSGGQPSDLTGVDPALLPIAHICDAPLPGPTTTDGLRTEARTERLLPGGGQLPLSEFVRTLPAGIPLNVEVPGATEGTVDEKAQAAFDATAELLHDLA